MAERGFGRPTSRRIVVAALAISVGAMSCAPAPEGEGGSSDSPSLVAAVRGLAEARKGLMQANMQRLEMAAFDVEATLGAMQDSGYRSYTPTGILEELLQTLNSALLAVPGDPPVPGPQIEYVGYRAERPWQIVLVPDDEARVLHVEAFGSSLENPVVTREVRVPEY